MKRWLKIFLGLFFLALLVVPAAAGFWLWDFVHKPHKGYSEAERLITIEPGIGARTILTRLESAGVLPNADLARAFLVYRLGDPSLKAGEYRFDQPLNTPEVLEKLVRGEVVTYPVTLIEGLTFEEMADTLEAKGFGDAEIFKREMGRSDLIADLDPKAENLEGYLYPDTYSFARGTEESEIVATMVRTFRKRFNSQVVAAHAGAPVQRTVRELVTLASIVEKEARLDEERGRIAGVYANRLRIGMGLYADPTVIYGIKLLGTWDGNLRRKDLKIDSPYNTYVYPGLPPGPICSPGVASMVAAASPDETEHLYFVSRNDGSHVFARTLAEHNRNVTRWQKLYWRQRWAEERRSR